MKGVPKPSHVFELFDAFTLANNHMLDYTEQGLTDTLDFLSTINKKSFGVGLDRQSSFAPLLVDCDGIRIALLGCSQWQNAGRKTAGTTPNHARKLSREIRKLERDGYFVVVFPHWNYEYMDYPAPANRKFAHKLIDAGAHVVVGSHPHVIQGFETYQERYIFHSLGNFIFREFDIEDSRISDTFVVSLVIDESRQYEVQVIPVYTDEAQIRILNEDGSIRLHDHFREISTVFDDEKLYKTAFYEQATQGSDRISGELADMIRKYGIMYILSRLHRITLQDLKIKLYSRFRRP
jgi:poly-gamma-glutamate synthesis protein (capsule biosynthesis protein)